MGFNILKPTSFDIITINFNGGRFISETIQSVLSQTYKTFRILVQDGASKDNSLSILNMFKSSDKRILLSSEKDTGPANALNKALNRVDSDYVLFLNSDDLLMPLSLERLNLLILDNPSADIIIGSGKLVDEFGATIQNYYPAKFSRYKYAYGVSVPMHPATIFRADFIKNNSLQFNESNKSCWDGEFIVDCSFHEPKIIYTNDLIASFRIHSSSISSNLHNSNYLADQNSLFLKIQGRSFKFYDHILGYLLRIIYLGVPRLFHRLTTMK